MPTLHELIEAYKRALTARVQRTELITWGRSIAEALNREIETHRTLEDAYLAELAEQRRRANTPRERGDTTRYGMPPHGAPFARLPYVLPWDMPIAELNAFWLEVQCSCARTTGVPLRLMAGNVGWHRTLREIVPKLRCSRIGCDRPPTRVRLMTGGHENQSWYQLVPAGDEQMFPH